MQKFRNLTHKRDIFSIMWIFDLLNMAIFGGVTSKLNITKMSLPDVNSICLNGGQKYNTYLSHAFSRKNLPYWLMCRKIRIFAILGNMGHFQNWVSLQISQYGSEWESQLAWSPRRDPRQTHEIIFWIFRFKNIRPILYSQNESLRKCPQKSWKIFKIEIFKI